MNKGIFSRKSLIAASIAASLLAGAGTTSANPVNRTLEHACQLPLVGEDLIVTDLTYGFPATNTAEVTARIAIQDLFRDALFLVNTATIGGSVELDTVIDYRSLNVPGSVSLSFPDTEVPSGTGSFDITALGTQVLPEYNQSGPDSVTVGDMEITFDSRHPDGSPTGLGEFSASCALLSEDSLIPVPEPDPVYVHPGSIDFGSVQSGVAVTKVITITNPSNEPMTGLTLALSGDNSFFYSTNCPASLAPGDSCNVEVVFAPAAEGSYSATLDVSSSILNVFVALSGTSSIEKIGIPDVFPKTIDFGLQDFGQTTSETITIGNTGNGSLFINNIHYQGSSDFFIDNACIGRVLAPEETCDLGVQYTAQTEGEVTGSVDIETSEGTIDVSISGEGGFIETDPAPVIALDGSTYIARSGSTLPLAGTLTNLKLMLSQGNLEADLSLEPTEGRFAVIKGWNRWTSTARIEFEQTRITTGKLESGLLATSSEMYVKVPEVTVPILGMDVRLGGGESCRTSEPVTINLESAEGTTFSPSGGGRVVGTYALPELENCGFLTGLLNGYMAGPDNTLELDLTVTN